MGVENRKYAATKFFLYTAAGSAFLLASSLVLGVPAPGRHRAATFDFRELAAWNGLSGTAEVLLFIGFMAAFAIKAPLFPFHTWLPDVHTEAPTAGSVVLAGVIIKMGAFGFVRFSFELFPQASVDLAPLAGARDHRHPVRRDRCRDADRLETRRSRTRRSRTWAS